MKVEKINTASSMFTNSNTKPIVREGEANNALIEMGLTSETVRQIALAAASARADALSVDPYGTPGTLSYIHGVRAVRLSLKPLGWRASREGNVEATVHDDLGIQVLFQNVDRACDPLNPPRSISEKGSESRKLVHAGQADLFEQVSSKTKSQFGKVPKVWVICVSVDDENVRAEVSAPDSFSGSQYEGFSQRIFVMDECFEPNPIPTPTETGDAFDFDVSVTRK